MQRRRSFHFILLLCSLALALPSAAQVVVGTVTVGFQPNAVAVNSVTNKTYVVNYCGNDPNCQSNIGTVTVIDGATLSTQSVNVGMTPVAVAVNPVTNKIYVANDFGDCGCFSTVTVIDGATNNTTTVNVEAVPYAVAVNSVTDKIYVTNTCGTDAMNCASLGTVT